MPLLANVVSNNYSDNSSWHLPYLSLSIRIHVNTQSCLSLDISVHHVLNEAAPTLCYFHLGLGQYKLSPEENGPLLDIQEVY